MERPDTFRIRSYGWQELAQMYSPGISPASATRRLRRWIDFHPGLLKALVKAGWRKGNRLLTPRHVTILISHLGEP